MADKKSINKATKEDLMRESDELGDELAERIVNFIHDKGGINNLEELNQVSNIGDKTIKSIRTHFAV